MVATPITGKIKIPCGDYQDIVPLVRTNMQGEEFIVGVVQSWSIYRCDEKAEIVISGYTFFTPFGAFYKAHGNNNVIGWQIDKGQIVAFTLTPDDEEKFERGVIK